MKILHVGPVYSNCASGPSRSILGLAEGQVSIGCGVALLPSQPTKLEKENIPKGIILLPSPKRRHLNPWKLPKDWLHIIIDNFGKPDIIDIHDTFIPFQVALAKLFRKEDWPYIFTPRGSLSPLALNVKSFKKKLGSLFFHNRFIENSKAIHALCENEANDIRRLYPQHKIFILPNGIEESLLYLSNQLAPMELKDFYKDEDLVIGFTGRINVYHKGVDLLLLSLNSLQDRELGKNIKLLIVGPFYTSHDKYQVKALINSLKFPDRVMIYGPAYGQEKWRLLKACDVFIHTSRFEGMPMAVIEAMAFGKPCIVTPGSNMQDIISDCNGGWLCEESVDSIANTIIQIEREEILRRGINARNYAKEHLVWPMIARQYIEEITRI